jgi:thioesterase domain-containing protein
MESLNRFVFGIGNPFFFSPEQFNGSLRDLGTLYTAWIRTAVAKQDFPTRRASDARVQIYSGGWSLGGMLSLEIAKHLADDDDIKVVGILMVDTICPDALKEHTRPHPAEEVANVDLANNKVLAWRCMAQATRMVGEWRIPVWEGDFAGTRPKTVLLQAKKRTLAQDGPLWIRGLDIFRKDKDLGWGEYDEEMFTQVFPVDGHHFDLFNFERVGETTRVVKQALEKLDKEPRTS